MMAKQSIEAFLVDLSTSAPVPGGGGASGCGAAIGMALGSMVANLTTGKKKYAEYQAEIDEILVKAEKIRAELLEFMDKDAEAFEPLSKAYGLPKNTPEEIEERDRIMEAALVVASEAPLALMDKIMEAMKLMDRMAVIGSRLAISDVGVGIQMLSAALEGASLNVFINTKLMKDREKAESLNQKADVLLTEGREITKRTFDSVVAAIR